MVLSDKDGEQLETSRDGEPTSYLHGAGNIIRGLEAQLKGHSAGDSLRVELAPEYAYGLRQDKLRQRV